ncbi:response regulator transcription factor [Clostridium amazonitimonense]|uniref:response regulator transcription factor n=1 Tax=Clostridium amazonitimonense TaxID=1499689 RepID=UPI0005094C93|nr:response regulator [Clostridium amazonitimonense]
MFKVFIVDDEYFAREGMKRTIDWNSLDCEVCGEADNSIKAIEHCKILKPDIIVTDINMPGMNGLEMAFNIKTFLPDCKFIIITGYDEFQYAKEAIKLKAVDFILKPIDEIELIEAIKHCIEDLNKLALNRSVAQEKLLLDAMRGRFSEKKVMLDTLSESRIDLNAIRIISIENDSYNGLVEEELADKFYMQNRVIRDLIHKYFKNRYYVVDCHLYRVAIVLEENEEHNDLKESLKSFTKKIKEVLNITVTLGVSSRTSLINIKEAYSESKEAISHKLYLGKDKIIYFENILKNGSTINLDFTKEKSEINLYVKAKDRRKIENKLKDLFTKFKIYKSKEDFIRGISIEIILESLSVLKNYNACIKSMDLEESNIYEYAAKLNIIDELYEFVYSYLMKVVDILREKDAESEETGIEKAVEFLKAHYREDISLKDVASYAYLSESYLSRKMKKVLGIGFSEYITKLRMERAIELLTEPKAKVTEVALQVGYTDYRYFSQSFKKYTGYSPREFAKDKK